MSLSEIIVKIIGIVLAIVGLLLLLSLVGLGFGVTLSPWWLCLLAGVVFMGAGIYIIRGGNFTV
jgi:hypothetical protein